MEEKEKIRWAASLYPGDECRCNIIDIEGKLIIENAIITIHANSILDNCVIGFCHNNDSFIRISYPNLMPYN